MKLCILILSLILLLCGCAKVLIAEPGDATIRPPSEVQLNSNDVSILFPLPNSTAERDALLAMESLRSQDGTPIFPRSDFDRMLAIASGDAGKVGPRQIVFPASIKNDFTSWKIAGIRFDPIAVGGSSEISDVFGHSPQLRLVLQPVTEENGRGIVVHDMALHLIYSFIESREDTGSPALIGKATPDETAVNKIIQELKDIKEFCQENGVNTDSQFSIHPGLQQQIPGLSQRLKQLLEKHLHQTRLNSGAIMGLHGGRNEPWIFLAFLRAPLVTGEFIPFPSAGTAPLQDQKMGHMITFLDTPRIQPVPQTYNRMPVTNNLAVPGEFRRGVSTAPLFERGLDFQDFASLGKDENGAIIKDSEIRNADIADFIANPELSHFFNTDCASCHTETTRREILKLPRSKFAYDLPDGVSELDPNMIPADRWNVRNFGWFRSQPTITLRTANETAEVVEFLHKLADKGE